MLHRHYPASTLLRPCPTPAMAVGFRNVEDATLATDGSPPITRTTFPTCRAHLYGAFLSSLSAGAHLFSLSVSLFDLEPVFSPRCLRGGTAPRSSARRASRPERCGSFPLPYDLRRLVRRLRTAHEMAMYRSRRRLRVAVRVPSAGSTYPEIQRAIKADFGTTAEAGSPFPHSPN